MPLSEESYMVNLSSVAPVPKIKAPTEFPPLQKYTLQIFI